MCVSLEAERGDALRAGAAKGAVGTALDDAKYYLVGAPPRARRSFGPAQRPFGCGAKSGAAGRVGSVGSTFVEHHRDVGAQPLLDLDRSFRREQAAVPIDARLEGDSLLVEPRPARE